MKFRLTLIILLITPLLFGSDKPYMFGDKDNQQKLNFKLNMMFDDVYNNEGYNLKTYGNQTITGVKTFSEVSVTTATITKLTATGFPRKNVIINGNMDIWQRGTSTAAPTTQTYIADRFEYNISVSTARHTLSQSSDVPTVAQAGCKLNYSLKADCTTADDSMGSTDLINWQYTIEGYDAKTLIGQSVTLSFWVKATKTGIYSVFFKTGSDDYNYVAEYTVNSASTWEQKTVTLTMADGATGTWNFTNGAGLVLGFVLASGSNYTTSTLSWQASNKMASTSQVNAVDSTDNDFYLTGVQLELGSNKTELERRLITDELALCQRYYEKSFPLTTAPANTSGRTYPRLVATAEATTTLLAPIIFKVSKRATPTMAYYSDNGGNIVWAWWSGGTWADASATSNGGGYTNENQSIALLTVSGAGLSGCQEIVGHWTASAEF